MGHNIRGTCYSSPVTDPPSRPARQRPSRLGAFDAAMLTVVLIWGCNFSVTKGAFGELPPLAFTAVRFAAATALLLPLTRRLEGGGPLPRGSLGRLVALGVVGNTLYQLGFVLGLARTTASNSALLLSSMPAVVAVLAGMLGVERVTRRVGWGIAVASAGVALVVAASGVGFSDATLTGDLLTLGAVLCWAAYTLGLRTLPPGVTPLRVTAVTTAAGTPGLLLAGVPELAATDLAAVGVRAWGALAYSTYLSLVVAYLLWNRSVKAVGPSRTAAYMCLTPLVAVAAAWLLLGEVPVPRQGAGAALIIAGVWLTRQA
jgi:drug/metabolite transporter (DMT)-like permease